MNMELNSILITEQCKSCNLLVYVSEILGKTSILIAFLCRVLSLIDISYCVKQMFNLFPETLV